jgi:ABC-type transport system involved in cytochrome c biogenesis permease subunit
MTTIIITGAGLIAIGFGLWKTWKNKKLSTAEKIQKTAEEAAKAAILTEQARKSIKK